ncbi:uncharacterized protein LOC121979546 isoform X3 [Zingiber officinale]|uniref:uncharacterized protein LOC121979546 isoform X3 n=1 Tax=Zingiber officinale TaxID=94328 RepID=UPI001C4B8C27|nr:uncharacterized protein LOC121979546 isoform X3 [Zingiber officinale]
MSSTSMISSSRSGRRRTTSSASRPNRTISTLAIRNPNPRFRMLREELQLLQKPGSYVGEVVKVMGKSKVLVKHWCYIFLRFKKGRLLDLCIATKMENSLHWRKQTSLMEYMFMKSALYDS